MMRGAILACLLLSTVSAYAAGSEAPVSAGALARAMQQAKYSDGFEARLSIFVTKANGSHPAPIKLSVVGQLSADKQRLLIRGISPASVHDHFYAAEWNTDGHIRAVEYRHAQNKYTGLDPLSRMFDSSLVIWDMFSPWWSWPRQILEGVERVDGRECTVIRSVIDANNLAINEVESCVDQRAKLSLRTRLFGKHHALLRTTTVEKAMHKGGGDLMTAKKMTIADASHASTAIEIYAGDEQYEITGGTFAALDLLRPDDQKDPR